ncbi:MAG: DUF11 domain-containing protein, partial [Candidatus Contendobacter sp.]|nr:DUF11 domain-containing protein [Candidatus Contendobacter sp.]
MTRQQWIAFILLGLLLGTNPARADTILSDFDGTNFGFAFGSWTGQTTPGPTFVTIGGLATEQGGAGNFPFAATNFTGMGVAMTAQLGAGNLASEFQVHLIDGADNRAVFVFPATSFTNTSFATVFVPAPTFNIGPGPVDLTKIVRFLVMGDFSSDDRLEIKIDRIFVTTQADLSVTKIDSPDPVTAGTNLTYTITANNAGPNTAASVSLSDTLPADTTFESVSVPGGWSCSTPAVGAGGTLTCSIASLSALANATFTLVVAVSPSVANGTVLSNTATLSSTTTDPDPGNNSATATTTVANSADLAITKTDGVANATPGGSVTYTIVASNAGPDGVPDAT